MDKLSSFKDNFPKLWAKLNDNQRRYVIERHKYTTDKECAIAIGLKPNTIYRWPEYVNEAVEAFYDNIIWIAEETLSDAVARAALVKAEALYDIEDKDRMDKAATEVLDRIMGRPTSRTELTGAEGGELNISVTLDD